MENQANPEETEPQGPITGENGNLNFQNHTAPIPSQGGEDIFPEGHNPSLQHTSQASVPPYPGSQPPVGSYYPSSPGMQPSASTHYSGSQPSPTGIYNSGSQQPPMGMHYSRQQMQRPGLYHTPSPLSHSQREGKIDSGFSALFDMSFTRWATPGVVKFVYIIFMVVATLYGISFFMGAIISFYESPLVGLLLLSLAIIVPLLILILARLGIEITLASIRTAQYSRLILDELRKNK